MNDELAANAFSALGSATRVALLRLLVRAGEQGMNVTQLRDALDVPATTLSHHLNKLVSAALVRQQRDGRALVCCADYESIRHLTAFLMQDCCRGVFPAAATRGAPPRPPRSRRS
ncbi:MAG: metalloregulator ArsR/SmtB family transcription factor [Pseudomonadota bacterium]